MITIQVDTHPFDNELKLYSTKQFTFEPGLTSLVGCNGSGKSTLIDCYLKPYLDKQKIPVIHYNDRRSGGTHLMDAMLNSGDMSTLAGMAFASEGERIFLVLTLYSECCNLYSLSTKINRYLLFLMLAIPECQ